MIVIRPVTLAPSVVTTNAVDAEGPWVSTTPYATGDIRSYERQRWKSAKPNNIGKVPGVPDADGTIWWTLVGPTNSAAMFDGKVGTSTTRTGSLTVSFPPGLIDSLALLNTVATTARAQLTNAAGTVVWSRTIQTDDPSEVADWYEWFFTEPKSRTELTFLDLPPFADGVLTVTLTGATASSVVSCGMLVVGRQLDAGLDKVGVKFDLDDFNVVKTDGYGQTTIKLIGTAKKLTLTAEIKNIRLDAVGKGMQSVAGVPVVCIVGGGLYDLFTVYGLVGFSIDLPAGTFSYCSFTIKGLI